MNPQQMMKQARKMQKQMEEIQEQLKEQTVSASAGGGAVKAVASCDGKLESVTIDPDIVDLDDLDMLQDLILAASNEALRQAHEISDEKMNSVTGGMNIPGLL
ncbi:MAG: YbaB/EbfC family nucleoid-associated protein [Coriobacteriales bacterium]|nr:YbaB/EbfC family nucleoid-associated protein [Coriobacteriales bacterium]